MINLDDDVDNVGCSKTKLVGTYLLSFRMFDDIEDGGVASLNNTDDNATGSISRDRVVASGDCGRTNLVVTLSLIFFQSLSNNNGTDSISNGGNSTSFQSTFLGNSLINTIVLDITSIESDDDDSMIRICLMVVITMEVVPMPELYYYLPK